LHKVKIIFYNFKMKILDLSLSQNFANKTKNTSTKGLYETSEVPSTGELDNDNVESAATTGARRIFSGKNEKAEKAEKERDLKNCRGYIIKILGLKDYSTKELQNKALKLGYKIEDIQSVLDQLIKDNWINDKRLAENLIECYSGRKGKSWLQQKLTIRQIDREIIAKVLSEIDLVPDDKFKKQVEAKYKVKFGEYIEPKVKQKIIAFLAGRGFGNVFGILKQWESGN
jgi:SOS response regulatory protein OraA/RecX